MLVEQLGALKGINIPLQAVLLILNIPVALLCCKGISIRFTAVSLAQVALTSFFLQVCSFAPIFVEEFLNVIFGGVVMGASIVIALRGNASTGGTDFIALYVSNKTGRSIWSFVFMGNAADVLFVRRDLWMAIRGVFDHLPVHLHAHDLRLPSPL